MNTDTLNYRGTSPDGCHAEVRASGEPYSTGYSVFTWRDTGTGVHCWREQHEKQWSEAHSIARAWLVQTTTALRMRAAGLRGIYAAPISTRAHRFPPTMHSAGINATRAGNYLKRTTDLTGDDHAAMAVYWARRRDAAQKRWGAIADRAMLELFGRTMGITDYRISGIGRDEFPERIKTRLRLLNRFASHALTVQLAHASAAGKTRTTRAMIAAFGEAAYRN